MLVSQDQPDLNDTLRKLFERPRSSKKTEPTALFQQQPPTPAPENGGEKFSPAPETQPGSAAAPISFKPLAQRFRALVQ